MVGKVVLIISLTSLCCCLYGILFTILEVEENLCRMTYMFEYPQFVRIHFDENKKFAPYGLYAYSEGYLTEKARSMKFTGAPVIFIPGNGGSYKQARSLASVAIRKGIDNHWDQHLDYFSIDFNGQYSGLFGGYLEYQKAYLKECIKTVLNLYKSLPNRPRQLILVGHSMGGKIAQSILADKDYSKYINTVISIASPMDRPVINLDVHFEAFYRKLDNILLENRSIYMNTDGNYCKKEKLFELNNSGTNKTLDNALLITIGGGSRDILVRTGLTHSKFSDIHAIATSIPNVWVTTDHLCSVWCLQLVLVVNRFLYSIIAPSNSRYNFKSAQYFIEDKFVKVAKAHHFFVKPHQIYRNKGVKLVSSENNIGNWIEESRRVYSKQFEYGINQTHVEMIRLVDSPQYKMLYAEVSNVENDEWVFGCAALGIRQNMRYCSEAIPLYHHVNKLPSIREKRRFLSIDLHKIKQTNVSWTHILLRLLPTKEVVSLKVDIHDPADRTVRINMPSWYSFQQKIALEDTILGSSFYNINVYGLHDSHQSLAFKIRPRSCTRSKYHVVAQVCIPWARGCDRYQYFTDAKNELLYVHAPSSKPPNYNTTENPLLVNLHLDPNCRYHISYKSSFGGTISRINLQYFQWMPAHLTAILLLALRYQISLTPIRMPFKCGKLHSALLNSSSFFVIMGVRVFAKLLSGIENLPKPDPFNQSMLVLFIVHGSSIAILVLATAGLWLAITFYGNAAHTILLKLIQLPIPQISGVMMPIIEKFPISAGVVLISIASASCGGVAMLCGCCIYFILITKQYEDYLEDFVYKTAKIIAKKLFGKFADRFLKRRRTENKEKTDELTERVAALKDGHENTDNAEKSVSDNQQNAENAEETVSTAEVKQIQENTENNDVQNAGDEGNSSQLEILDSNEDVIETEGNEEDEELDRLLKEAIESQKQMHQEKLNQRERKEYDSVHEGISSINFHLTMFLLLVILTVLNLPSTISWAKNFKYSPILTPDPSFTPAVIVILSSSVLWQFSTPRNVYAYQFVSSILYVCGAICILYCQDSVYRLNGVISSVFLLVTLHQICTPAKPEVEGAGDSDDDFKDKLDKLRTFIGDAASIEQ